jgi:hypothetical protein
MYTEFWLKTEGKKPLGRPKFRRERDIKTDLKNRVGGCGLDYFFLGLEPVAGSCEHGNESCSSVIRREFLTR